MREHGSEEWQPCDAEKFSGAESSLLTILDVQKWNEGSYCCVIHNYAGNRTSKPATITVGKNTNTHMLTFVTIIPTSAISLYTADPPRITTHPQNIDNAVPGKPVTFTARVTGMKPLRYQWQWKPAGEGSSSGEWKLCDAGRFLGADNSTLTISSTLKSNEGSFRCAVSNCAGSQTSRPANLSVGMNPCFISFV